MESGHIECVGSIVGQIEKLLQNRNIVLSTGEHISIVDVNSGCPVVGSEPCGDRFKLLISYAGNQLMWEVLFNARCPRLPPDFIFHDAGFEPDIEKITGLERWSVDDSGCLSLVVQQLLDEYRVYQVEQIQGTRVQFEYDSLVSGLEGTADIEVHINKPPATTTNGMSNYQLNGSSLNGVTFLVKLNIDFSRLPQYLLEIDNLEDSKVLLMLIYQSLDGGRVTPHLLLSPNLQSIFHQYGEFKLRPFPQNSSASDYVPAVVDQINEFVKIICLMFDKRRDYIKAFCSTFNKNVLEYDVSSYYKISFLFNHRDFHFIFTINLTTRFPTEQPVFKLQSIYHVDQSGLPYQRLVSNYPYSPRWVPQEMVDRTKDYIFKSILDFQKESVCHGMKWELT